MQHRCATELALAQPCPLEMLNDVPVTREGENAKSVRRERQQAATDPKARGTTNTVEKERWKSEIQQQFVHLLSLFF